MPSIEGTASIMGTFLTNLGTPNRLVLVSHVEIPSCQSFPSHKPRNKWQHNGPTEINDNIMDRPSYSVKEPIDWASSN
jgi:hypothetical protein